VLLDHVVPSARVDVVEALEHCLGSWLAYRDAVAHACGLERGEDGKPRRRAMP
jgi:hypothetical protein